MDKSIEDYREFLKDNVRLRTDFSRTDQSRGVPPPPVAKPYPPDGRLIDLVARREWTAPPRVDLAAAIERRRSHRHFTGKPLGLDELSFLLWATQGVTRLVGPGTALRTVPSAGCRHALETYLFIFAVNGLDGGVYRYLPLEHRLLFEFHEEQLAAKLARGALGQTFAGRAAVTFAWTAIPYRTEWRYGNASHKVIALDAGHVCQNLYLACEAIGAGTCAIAAYDQQAMDQLLRLDGLEEFTVYLAPVGKVG